MSGRLQGRVAVVTGAADGMGRAITETFLREGASVLAADLAGDKLAAAFPAHDRLRLVTIDVTTADAASHVIGGAIDAFGALDILVNNAGIVEYEPIETMTDANWSRTLSVNLTATFALSRAAIPHLRAGESGRIINLASINAFRSTLGLAAYAAAKHGVAGLTKTLAVELGPDKITANYICPGAILTGMTRPLMDADPSIKGLFESFGVLGRMGMPEDIANAALFLASDEASFITGHGLVVDGGFLAKV
ncbi:SDR family NAD(P)-dependent oxidoreductase [Sphingomonas sp.]|uniref:SDR family NAD(P)-dependent oxidoreductase n=1 Tax=Sphingomonas sp. TaxID=28214 RepID=UPI00333EA90D